MFDAPIDATYAWLGIALVSVVTAGVVASLPSSPPPDAAGVAHTIDSVADGEHPATAEHGLGADRIRLTDRSVALETGDEVAHTTLLAPRITPVLTWEEGSDDLRRVLKGVPPEQVFDDPGAFEDAARDARAADHEWHPAPNRLRVRQAHYDDVRVTLVG
ncbi:DUF7283 family protein [Halorubrum vacuolatum]|uniref:Uncharacterized protein n=1 Tax=Halorubrum vacuolatum TaxID=63740 RepID=A0A238X426_HALVU|nr:hypothetical protein [Halorubrum vacuolatum]SNR53450.1 hypothetical protein SAMN06264855_11328 [Halorubrum vacuolatum]